MFKNITKKERIKLAKTLCKNRAKKIDNMRWKAENKLIRKQLESWYIPTKFLLIIDKAIKKYPLIHQSLEGNPYVDRGHFITSQIYWSAVFLNRIEEKKHEHDEELIYMKIQIFYDIFNIRDKNFSISYRDYIQEYIDNNDKIAEVTEFHKSLIAVINNGLERMELEEELSKKAYSKAPVKRTKI